MRVGTRSPARVPPWRLHVRSPCPRTIGYSIIPLAPLNRAPFDVDHLMDMGVSGIDALRHPRDPGLQAAGDSPRRSASIFRSTLRTRGDPPAFRWSIPAPRCSPIRSRPAAGAAPRMIVAACRGVDYSRNPAYRILHRRISCSLNERHQFLDPAGLIRVPARFPRFFGRGRHPSAEFSIRSSVRAHLAPAAFRSSTRVLVLALALERQRRHPSFE